MIAGCSTQAVSKVWLEAPGWSRGVLIGNSGINEPVAMLVDEDGSLYLATFDDADPPHPQIWRFDRNGTLVWQEILEEVEINFPSHPRLTFTSQGVNFFWVDEGHLIETVLDRQGSVISEPSRISGELDVDTFDVEAFQAGLSIWVGGSDDQPGLYSRTVDGAWSLIDPRGSRPDAAVDADGNIHLAWAHIPANRVQTEFVYGFYPNGDLAQGRYNVVLQPEFRTTDRIEGPRIALTDGLVFIFWTTEIKTGRQAGEIVSSYVSFNQGQEKLFIAGQRITVPSSANLEYEYETEDSFVSSPRLAWSPEDRGTTQIIQLTPNTSFSDQVVLALRARVSYRSQPQRSQIGLLFFDGEVYESYQLITTSQAASINPTLVSGLDGYLYLSWTEKDPRGENVIYLATTSSDMRATFNEVSSDDVKTMLSETVFGLLSGMAFVPFVLIWLVPPMLLVAITSKLRHPEDSFFNPRTLISLGISLAGYWLLKLGMVPTLRTVVPFLVWIPIIPSGWQMILRIGIPLLIAGLGMFIAYRATYGRDRKSPFLFMVIYAIADGLLTMAVYGYSMMGF
jgi:hypothetical protein